MKIQTVCACVHPIPGNSHWYHPAPWIANLAQMESHPQFIWYWMREGSYQIPRSCMEIRLRAYQLKQEIKDEEVLTLSVPVVFLNSPNLSPYFSLNKFERI